MATINREEFQAFLDEPRREKIVEINTAKGPKKFRLLEMTEEDGAAYEIACQSNGKYDFRKARREMIALMLVDADGNRILASGDEIKGPTGLGRVNKLWAACLELNDYSEKDITDITKNSEGAEG